MSELTIIVVVAIALVLAAAIYYQRKLSVQAVLDKARKEAADSVNTVEEIYAQIVICTLLNGEEFETAEEIEKDLKKRDKTLAELEEKGFGDSLYGSLNEVEKKIYLIINGYDLKLFPDYLVAKAINVFR